MHRHGPKVRGSHARAQPNGASSRGANRVWSTLPTPRARPVSRPTSLPVQHPALAVAYDPGRRSSLRETARQIRNLSVPALIRPATHPKVADEPELIAR
jgi:hypothetical protein